MYCVGCYCIVRSRKCFIAACCNLRFAKTVMPVKITLPQLSSGEKLGSTQVVSRIARFIVLLVILQTVIKFHLISAC